MLVGEVVPGGPWPGPGTHTRLIRLKQGKEVTTGHWPETVSWVGCQALDFYMLL